MIFVTVGHQMPFDRLVRLVDLWAEKRGRSDVFAQIGETQYRPRNFQSAGFLSDAQFEDMIARAPAGGAHAGVGSIIRSLTVGKPMLVLARRSHLAETRNDHQVATAAHFSSKGQLLVGNDDDFLEKLDALESFRPQSLLRNTASRGLLSVVRQFIDSQLAAGETFAFEDEQEDARTS